MPHTLIAKPQTTEPPKKPQHAPDTQQVDGFGLSEKELPGASRLVWSLTLALFTFTAWAWYFKLDEVSTGTGKVIASSKEQVIKSLEGGVLASLYVQEGSIVEKGEVLAQLDPTRIESAVEESASRSRAAQATSARLMAEVNNIPLQFPQEVLEEPDLVKAETALFQSRRESLEKSLSGLNEAMRLIRSELQLTTPLVTRGAASTVEVLRLKRQLNELQNKYTDTQTQYLVKAREELAKANAEIEAQQSVTRGRNDSLTRLTFTSPVRGVIKDIEVNTVGGVIPPNGQLMRIVPLDERLQVETRIAPRDIAYIHPGQAATVKISAYDYSIYGGLPGKVTLISPDTLQDDVHRDVYYYRVYIITDTDSLLSKTNKELPIVPGMIATVDIHTGEKTVLSYLMKPLNKTQEALRER
ncbi:HlyD family type I secretion periplasmic adaptor subunit [Pseudomonas sp. GM17]|uniref:HlyD family type I secretion periplasmic adaptor subunit n=1 Tax=Pseudomonas sp. GM17 TaxID=1144323 RepID=UPI0002727256|nr:HlyD family type I secretion periplasmic adaptor subunit [Pseudomonas sp. GM17]WIE49834.1 HlyD family type I secretion periplasmic adaptor subunit [Pseudomonas sp. GM17]